MICTKTEASRVSLMSLSSSEKSVGSQDEGNDGLISYSKFEMNSSLALYLKKENKELKIDKNDKKEVNFTIKKESSRNLITLRTKRNDDIDIPQEIQKMKNLTFKSMKF